MINLDLPKSLEIGGQTFEIRSDYRDIINICIALNDPELSQNEKVYVALTAFYPDADKISMANIQEALDKCFWFIDCGEETDKDDKSPRLMDWEQDYPYIVAPINRVANKEVREVEYMHWWTFVGYYREIGDCTFAQIVRIRDQLAKHKKLDKSDKDWYKHNRNIVDLKQKYSDEERELIKQLV
jgi:hypothetical protein